MYIQYPIILQLCTIYRFSILFNNVCGFNSKLRYNTSQEYIKKYDLMCLSETKCDFIVENKIME